MEHPKASSPEKRLDATDKQSLVQIHLAEYQALTNRNTYSIVIQSSFWAMIVFYVTLIGTVWPKDQTYHPLVVWGSGIVLQLFALAFGAFSWEQYNNVRYLERKLRPHLAALVSSDSFWGYEQYLFQQRGNRAQWWEYSLPIGAAVVLFIAAAFRSWELRLFQSQFSMGLVFWDLVGIIPNVVLLAVVFSVTRGLLVLRKDMVSRGDPLPRKHPGEHDI